MSTTAVSTALRAAIDTLSSASTKQRVRVPASAADQAALLEQIDTLNALLKALRTEVSSALITSVKAKRGTHSFGDYEVEITARQDRKEWDDVGLILEIAEQESPKTPKANKKIAKAVAECAGIGYWRVKELRKRAIEADLHCKKVSATPTVVANHRGAAVEVEA